MDLTKLTTDSVAATMACTLLLAIKVSYCLLKEAKLKGALGGRAPEDVSLNPQRKPQQFGKLVGPEKLLEKQQRWGRICGNDLESIPIALIIAWGSVVCGSPASYHIPLIATYTIARYLHTLFYAMGSLLRPVAFGIGLLCVYSMGLIALWTRIAA
jgi:hypothetical protein